MACTLQWVAYSLSIDLLLSEIDWQRTRVWKLRPEVMATFSSSLEEADIAASFAIAVTTCMQLQSNLERYAYNQICQLCHCSNHLQATPIEPGIRDIQSDLDTRCNLQPDLVKQVQATEDCFYCTKAHCKRDAPFMQERIGSTVNSARACPLVLTVQ